MNPTGFGSPQAGAFQAPNGTGKSGLFQSFGQKASSDQPETQNFYQPTVFGQNPSFGLNSGGMSSPGFGGTTPAFGRTSGPNHSSVFGPVSVFSQPSAFGPGTSQMSSVSNTASGQAQPVGFGQSSSSSGTKSVFGSAQNVTQSKGFGSSSFSFKPANEAVFKPIFSASPEPATPRTTSSSAFGPQMNTSTVSSSTTLSLSTGTKSGPLGFRFSQPAAAPSISAKENPFTSVTSTGASNPLQFTFSQPAAPSSVQPTTPSSFSFTVKAPTCQMAPLLTESSFGETRNKAEPCSDEKAVRAERGSTNVFTRLSKGVKRKEDPDVSSTGWETSVPEEEEFPEDAGQHPSKRPLMRSRRPLGGLFNRALSDIRKDGPNTGRHEATKETQQQAAMWEEAGQEDLPDSPATPPTEVERRREGLEWTAESDSTQTSDLKLEATLLVKDGVRRESSESQSGSSPTDCSTLQCRNVPPALNRKDVIQKHFARFGKVRRVFCRTGKNLAIVHFEDHASAAKAKKKGKILHRQELLLLWQRKKMSPGDNRSRPEAAEEGQEETESNATSSPVRRSSLRAPAVSSLVPLSHISQVKKSPLAKTLQFYADSQRDGSTETPSSERPLSSSLLHLVGQLAESTEEKYRLLEQRDKILRQGRPKRTDLDMSKVFVGTCPDMCPEKERFMRETRKQLSIYEVVPDTEMVDHTAAIKEYSRSSADQEEPLPHELRPLPVLSMTMGYLVAQIMDQGNNNYRDWYDFVWNRTRGIRKDITQQRLCCPDTVSLIEKCTRFHIHCAHHLCEEHISSFDAKINNENMTKCLQSLKELYEDLATRQSYCPQEAEFRQYSVLLKLNDGDILREVQQFRDDVRNSPEVKFAVKAFAAVNNNNFVRFFKLVKGASYLASCLLHRYFNQVRAKALKTLNVAHTVGPRSTTFPLDDIVRMLMFRNIAEATDFIQQYGLIITDEVLELSRITYQEPDLPLTEKKSEVILSKRSVVIGEVVNGGPFPNPPQHRPVCSFDDQNKYCGDWEGPGFEAPPAQSTAAAARGEELMPPTRVELQTQVVLAKDAGGPHVFEVPTGETREPVSVPPEGPSRQLFQPIIQPQPVRAPSPSPKPPQVYNNEDVMAVVDSVMEEVVAAAVMEVAHAAISYTSVALEESCVHGEALLVELLAQMVQEISSTEIHLEQERVAEKKRQLEKARRKQEHKAFLLEFSFSLFSEIVHEVLHDTIKETANLEIQRAVDEKADCVAKCTEKVCTALVEETLNTDIAMLVEDILEAELQRIHKYINRWRDVVAVRRQLKRQMRGFPAAPCCVDPRFKLKALAPSATAPPSIQDLARGLVHLGNAGTLSISSTRLLKVREEVIHQMRVHFFYQKLLHETVWAALDLPALVTEHISNPVDRIFWKAVLLLPSDHDSVSSLANRILSDWLEVKLGGGDTSDEEQSDGMLKTLCVINSLQEKKERIHNVHISVRASRGPLTEDGLLRMEELCELHGTGALMLLLPSWSTTKPGSSPEDVPLLSALLQLRQIQKASSWHCPLPLVILTPGPGDGDTQELADALMLHTLVQEGLISEFAFLFIPETTSDLQGSKQLIQALHWLLARAPPHVSLSCQTLLQLVETTLGHEFSPRVYRNHQERAAADLPFEDPAPVIHLYNAVIAHAADKASSQDLKKLSWPPAEFYLPQTRNVVPHLGWNSDQHLDWLREAILSLQLPQWTQPPPTGSWSELCSSVFVYAAQIPVSLRSQPLLMSQLENLLERVQLKGRLTQTSGSRQAATSWEDVDKNVSQIPWDDIVEICIDHKLKDWQIPGPPVCEDVVTEDGEILVYFPVDSVRGFLTPEEWTEAIRKTHRQKQQKRDGVTSATGTTPTSRCLRQRLFQRLAEPHRTPSPPLDITHTSTPQELLAHRVLQSLEEEQAESRRSMEQLQRWLDGAPVEHLSTPLFIPSSTLLFTPTGIRRSAVGDNAGDATLIQDPDVPSAEADWTEIRPVSLLKRLKDLDQQMVASQEEELVYRLKLRNLLSIVED